MGIFDPDSQHRTNRARQLATDIAQLRTQVQEAIEDAKTQDDRAIVVLNKIAKQRGFKTLNEYIDDVESKMAPEEKKKYDDMKKVFEEKDHDLDIAMQVSTGIVGIGITAGLAAASITTLVEHSVVTLALRAVGVGLLKGMTGQTKEGQMLSKAAQKILSTLMRDETLAGKAATAPRTPNIPVIAQPVLPLFGAVTSVYETVSGAKQRRELQDTIKELCVLRMTTKKIQQYARVSLIFASDGKAVADYAQTIQQLVIDGTIDQAEANEKVAATMNKLEPKMTKAIGEVNDKSVYESLVRLDKDSQTAWTDDDPSLDWIVSKIEEDARKEADEIGLPFSTGTILKA